VDTLLSNYKQALRAEGERLRGTHLDAYVRAPEPGGWLPALGALLAVLVVSALFGTMIWLVAADKAERNARELRALTEKQVDRPQPCPSY
jgi:hypothetical protein